MYVARVVWTRSPFLTVASRASTWIVEWCCESFRYNLFRLYLVRNVSLNEMVRKGLIVHKRRVAHLVVDTSLEVSSPSKMARPSSDKGDENDSPKDG